MNSLVFHISTRLICMSVSYNKSKINRQAKVMVKFLNGTTKKKTFRPFPEHENFSVIPEIIGQRSNCNQKVSTRRIEILNSVFLERITDILSYSDINCLIPKCGFLITKVKYASDASALHIYWTADLNLAEVTHVLPSVCGRLRHELSQLQSGKVPHLNFIYDQSSFKASDVDELLKIADFGPDPIDNEKLSNENLLKNRENGSVEPKVALFPAMEKHGHVLGIDREAIMQRVMRSINHIPLDSPKQSKSDLTIAESQQQREIDFKKYLHEQRVLRAKLAKERCKTVDPTVDMDALRKRKAASSNEETDEASDEMWENDDYFEDNETYENTTRP